MSILKKVLDGSHLSSLISKTNVHFVEGHLKCIQVQRGCCDHIVVGFTTTCAISAYLHLCWEYEVYMYLIQHYVIKFVTDLLTGQWFSPVSSTNKTDLHDITEILLSDIKYHTPLNGSVFPEFFVQNILPYCHMLIFFLQ